MSAIDDALRTINYSIPDSVLTFTFLTLNPYRQYTALSRDEAIRTDVIDGRVIPDADLVGGEQVVIPLDPIPKQVLDDGKFIYRIDEKYLQGRRIQNVLSLSTGDHRLDTYSNSYCATSVLGDNIGKILDANIGSDGGSSNRVKVLGHNTVLLQDRLTYNQVYLRCTLTNDINFSNFSPKATLSFIRLVMAATKSFIYNSCILYIDAGALQGGVTIGRFKEVIDGYSDAEETYYELLKNNFAKVSFQQDREAHTRHLKIISTGLV